MAVILLLSSHKSYNLWRIIRWQPNCLRGFCFPYVTSQYVWLPELSITPHHHHHIPPLFFFYNLRGVQGKKNEFHLVHPGPASLKRSYFYGRGWSSHLRMSCYLFSNYLFPLLGLSQGRAAIAPCQDQDGVISKPWKPQSETTG